MSHLPVSWNTEQFRPLRDFLRDLRWAFDERSIVASRLAALGPKALVTLREVLGSMNPSELLRVDRGFIEALATDAPVDLADLLAHAVEDPVIGQRLVQKFFVWHCAETLGRLDHDAREKILANIRAVDGFLSTEGGSEPLATVSGFGWLLTEPRFIDGLFFVPGLVPTQARALLHHVPKTGGTSQNAAIARHVPAAHMLYSCTSFDDLVVLGGSLFGVDVLNELSYSPRQTLIYGGHFNLSGALQRPSYRGLRCVSLFGAPVRLLSSGLRHFLSIASTDPAFARAHSVTDQEVAALAAIIRDGAHGKDSLMREVIERLLSSDGFQNHFRDPLAKWFLPHDIASYSSRLAKFESLVATTSSCVLYERPSLRCLADLGLVAEPGAVLERDNTSALSATALATLVGGDDWLLDRFRAHDLIGYSEQFYRYLLSHHEVRNDESSTV
jgi:hypothetical protein